MVHIFLSARKRQHVVFQQVTEPLLWLIQRPFLYIFTEWETIYSIILSLVLQPPKALTVECFLLKYQINYWNGTHAATWWEKRAQTCQRWLQSQLWWWTECPPAALEIWPQSLLHMAARCLWLQENQTPEKSRVLCCRNTAASESNSAGNKWKVTI